MEEKHKLTEQLKVIETEIYDKKIEMKSISLKLEIAYKYEDELAQRALAAREKITDLRNQMFTQNNELSKLYDKMAEIFKVFTGNFYRHE